MQLASIKIEKFRAIRHSTIRVGSELAIVGQNSAGKSSILRGLNAFFNFDAERSSFELGRHTFQKSSTAIIELVFSNVPLDCKLPKTSLGGSEVRARLKYKKAPGWQVMSEGNWIVAPADFHEELQKYVRYVYVPLRRDHEISGWGSGGLLKAAVEAWLKDRTSKRDTISPRVAELGASIQRSAFNGLSKQLRKITPINSAFTFDLEYSRQPDYRLLLQDLSLRVSEMGTTVDLEDCGSGTQSMTALALYSYLAELMGNTYILGIEEPEQNLHPQAQRELLANLRKLPLQVLFTTHSTVILDELRHDEVVLCRRKPSVTRGFETITRQLDKYFWADHGLDESRYYQFHRRRNSDFFFANFLILTESPIDSEIVSLLLEKSGVSRAAHGVSIIHLDGVMSIAYAYHLLKAIDLNFASIVDKDYFIPYINDVLDEDKQKGLTGSRDSRGFPRYRKEYKADTLLNTMLPDASERDKLLDLLHRNHSRAMDILEKKNVFCFKWSLEIDLINSSTARDLMFDQMNISGQKRTSKTLLVDRKKTIKKLETLLPVIDSLAPSNLPNSYKRLRKMLPELIRKASSYS
jgi:putative ATP-dependent endonuclease of OLD family